MAEDVEKEKKKDRADVFADADALKAAAHKNLAQKDYDVADFYYETGLFQHVAKNRYFGGVTLSVIAINALWIGFDTECNASVEADVTIEGCPVQPHDTIFWKVGDNCFCGFFTFELLVRFGAFRSKFDAMKDNWFVFDSILVFFMVFETWLIPIIFGGDSSSFSDFTLLRMLRLLRLTRMVRLMRSVPELVTMLKGMAVAMRSVSYTLLLMVILMYIFAIIFKSQIADTESKILEEAFNSIPKSMWTLLLAGCLLDDVGTIATATIRESWAIGCTFILFVLLAALMILNMLIGVLCAVVNAVAAAEKEKVLVNFVKARLMSVLETLDADGNGTISQREFDQLMNISEAVAALEDLGVDVPNLASLSDMLFEAEENSKYNRKVSCDEKEGQGEEDEVTMTFADFLEMVIRLRSDNAPAALDIVDLRKLIAKGIKDSGRRLNLIEKGNMELHRCATMIKAQIESAQLDSEMFAQKLCRLNSHCSTHELQPRLGC